MRFLFTVILLSALSAVSAQSNPSLSAVYDKKEHAIKLHWQHSDESITSYTLQRSSDNNSFMDVFTQNTTGIEQGSSIKFTDGNIKEGKNYYRIKIYRNGSSYEATIPVIIITGGAENAWVIYPVPVVGSVLNLQYTGSGVIEGVVTVIIKSVSSGTVFTRLRLASTTRNMQIPVSNIGQGLYDIHIYIGTEDVWNQRFLR